MKRFLLIVLMLITGIGTISAQNSRVITGKIVDENDEPIAGAAVFIKGRALASMPIWTVNICLRSKRERSFLKSR